MSYLLENKQKIDEIVFANRNKAYGAYVIRSTYGHTVLKSLGFVILSMAMLSALAWYFVNRKDVVHHNEQMVPTCIGIPVDLKPLDPVKPAVKGDPKPKGGTPSSSAISTNFSDTATVNTNTVINEDLTSTGSGSVGTAGPETNSGNSGTGTSTTEAISSDSKEPMLIADSNPEFEGGLKGLYSYLAANLRYPEIAKEVGKEGTVHVRFVVDEFGKVTDPIAQNNLGYGLDAEALRVVASIPKFKSPGIFKGKPVKVYFSLPIKFRLK